MRIKSLGNECIIAAACKNSLTALVDCTQKNGALQTEFDALNYMLTHQPPSAWAKREKKYHDDKKAWDERETELKKKMKRLNDEVKLLKDSERATRLQERVTVRFAPLPSHFLTESARCRACDDRIALAARCRCFAALRKGSWASRKPCASRVHESRRPSESKRTCCYVCLSFCRSSRARSVHRRAPRR
jgi:hypothetical protein